MTRLEASILRRNPFGLCEDDPQNTRTLTHMHIGHIEAAHVTEGM